MKTRYDAVIIGSGHNGLVAAAYLARAGKSVLVLERNETLGGATASQQVFPDYDAWLSRYSYLVSLFPQQITSDLGLKFETKRRSTASFTPYIREDGLAGGLVLSNVDESRSRESMHEMTGSDEAWSQYSKLIELETEFASLIWPTLMEPIPSRAKLKGQCNSATLQEAWKSFVEEPLGGVIEKYAKHDALRGLLLTDGKIGVFADAHHESLLQNRCFIYHVIGGGTGEWRVPVGGMKSLVVSLLDVCRSAGVEFATSASAHHVELGSDTHAITFEVDGTERTVDATYVLVNAGPKTFARLFGLEHRPTASDEGSVIKINMLLRRLPKLKSGVDSKEAFAGSFHIDEGYEQMETSYQTAMQGVLPNPAPGEIYCHTLTDASILSPELQAAGYQTLTLFGLDMPYRLFTEDHDVRRDEVKKRYLEGLDRLCDESFLDCLALDKNGEPCIEIKSPQDLEKEVDLDLGNIFHNELTWPFSDEPEVVGTWGVETEFPRVYRAGSSAQRGGAVSGIPGHHAAKAILTKI